MMMRISGPFDAQSAGLQRPNAAGHGAGSFRVPGETESGHAVQAPLSAPELSTVSALLAFQDETEIGRERRKMKAKSGFHLVDGLDALKLALLSGTVSAQQLDELESRLAGTDIDAQDPELGPILRAVRVRARVELAKLGR
jgi:Class II flagellar assembly regulator